MKTDWLNLLKTEMVKTAEKVPDGWKTVTEISEEMNKGISRTTQVLRILERSGAVERKKFLVLTGERLYPVNHFRQKK